MKKIFLMFAMLLFSVSLAWATPTIVNGKVYSGPTTASPVVSGAMVDVECLETASTAFDDTDAFGEYFTAVDCEIGYTVESCVGAICNSAVVNNTLPQQLNIVGVDIFNVPEFSVITALVALAGATVVFVVVRKRN